MTISEIKNVLDDIQANDIEVGDVVYKICPKCNPAHNGTCEDCAWQGTMRTCDIGVRVYCDGSCNQTDLQVVKKKLGDWNDLTFFQLWNVQYFPTKESAEKAMTEYNKIRNIPDKASRVLKYDLWEAKQRERFVRGKEKTDDNS